MQLRINKTFNSFTKTILTTNIVNENFFTSLLNTTSTTDIDVMLETIIKLQILIIKTTVLLFMDFWSIKLLQQILIISFVFSDLNNTTTTSNINIIFIKL